MSGIYATQIPYRTQVVKEEQCVQFSDVADDFAPKIELSRKRRKYPPIVNRLSVLGEGGIYGEYHGRYSSLPVSAEGRVEHQKLNQTAP